MLASAAGGGPASGPGCTLPLAAANAPGGSCVGNVCTYSFTFPSTNASGTLYELDAALNPSGGSGIDWSKDATHGVCGSGFICGTQTASQSSGTGQVSVTLPPGGANYAFAVRTRANSQSGFSDVFSPDTDGGGQLPPPTSVTVDTTQLAPDQFTLDIKVPSGTQANYVYVNYSYVNSAGVLTPAPNPYINTQAITPDASNTLVAVIPALPSNSKWPAASISAQIGNSPTPPTPSQQGSWSTPKTAGSSGSQDAYTTPALPIAPPGINRTGATATTTNFTFPDNPTGTPGTNYVLEAVSYIPPADPVWPTLGTLPQEGTFVSQGSVNTAATLSISGLNTTSAYAFRVRALSIRNPSGSKPPFPQYDTYTSTSGTAGQHLAPTSVTVDNTQATDSTFHLVVKPSPLDPAPPTFVKVQITYTNTSGITQTPTPWINTTALPPPDSSKNLQVDVPAPTSQCNTAFTNIKVWVGDSSNATDSSWSANSTAAATPAYTMPTLPNAAPTVTWNGTGGNATAPFTFPSNPSLPSPGTVYVLEAQSYTPGATDATLAAAGNPSYRGHPRFAANSR